MAASCLRCYGRHTDHAPPPVIPQVSSVFETSDFTHIGATPLGAEQCSVAIRRSAFTVAELIVAIGFLAIIAVAVIGLFVRLTASSSKSADQSVALEVANKLLDGYAAATPSVWKDVSSQLDLQTRAPGLQTTFYYRFQFKQIDPGNSLMGDLYRLDVDVYWWPPDPQNLQSSPNRRDYGKLQVHLARVVFLESFR